jgi:hypothetical protein
MKLAEFAQNADLVWLARTLAIFRRGRLLHNFDALCEPNNCGFGRQTAVGANDRN